MRANKRLNFEGRFSAQLAPVDARRVRRRVFLFAGSIVVILLVWFFLFSATWRVANVTVDGTHFLSAETVASMVPAEGSNIFRFNAQASRATIGALPEVSAVRIIRKLPRTIAIYVSERTPVLVWKTTQVLYDIDGNGIAFRIVPTGEDIAGLFVVNDEANVHVNVGQRVVPTRFVVAYQVMAERLPQIYPDLIDHMEVGETVYDLDVYMKDGRRVRFNVLSDVESQLRDLQRIAAQRSDLFTRSVIDLRVDRWAYIQ